MRGTSYAVVAAVVAAGGAGQLCTAPAGVTREEGAALVAVVAPAAAVPGAPRLPILFAENRGQVDPAAGYHARAAGHDLLFTPGGMVVAGAGRPLRLSLRGQRADAALQPEERRQAVLHHLVGSDPSRWRHRVPTFAAVRYPALLPGVDLRFHGARGFLEYDLHVAPGADPEAVTVEVEGATGLQLDDEGRLLLATEEGTLLHRTPEAYQVVGGERRLVAAAFELRPAQGGGHAYGFRVGPYDRSRELVIDPPLAYASYLGGAGDETAAGVAADSQGNTYVAGTLWSNGAADDLFVARVDASGALAWYARLGGSGRDRARAIAVDAAGEAVVAGSTDSPDLPWGSPAGLLDAFAVKLGSDGTFRWGRVLGGTDDDEVVALAAGPAGSIYMGGWTHSIDLPYTPGAWWSPYGDVAPQWRPNAPFLARLDAAGAVARATYVGPAWRLAALAVDAAGILYVGGEADWGPDGMTGPLWGVWQHGGLDAAHSSAYAFALDLETMTYRYQAFLAGARLGLRSEVNGIAPGPDGSVLLVGTTTFPDFVALIPLPCTEGCSYQGSSSAFAAALRPDGDLIYGRYLGGTSGSKGTAIATDGLGNASLAGWGEGPDFPVTEPDAGASGVYVVSLDASGHQTFGVRIPGSADEPPALALDSAGTLHVAGTVDSASALLAPTADAAQRTPGGARDLFVVRYGLPGTPPPTLALAYSGAADGAVGSAYLGALQASGGTPPYAYAALGLPPGLQLDPATGAISGVPTQAGSYAVQAQATDAGKQVVLFLFSLAVAPPPAADLGLELAPLPDVAPGAQVTAAAAVVNQGPGPATAAVIRYAPPLQGGARLLSMSAGGVACPAAACDLGSLAPGDRVPVALVLDPGSAPLSRTPRAPLDLGTLAVAAPEPDPTPGDAVRPLLASWVLPEADLGVSLAPLPAEILSGQSLVVAVEVTNAGPGDAGSVRLRGLGALAASLTFLQLASDRGSCAIDWAAGGRIDCDLGALPAGARVSISVSGQLLAPAAGAATLALAGEVTGSAFDANAANDTFATSLLLRRPTADLAVAAQLPPTVYLGETFEVRGRIENRGPEAATSAQLRYANPPGTPIAVLSGSASQGTCRFTGVSYLCDLGTIQPGAAVEVVLRLDPASVATSISAPGPLDLGTLQASAAEYDPTPGDASANLFTVLAQRHAELSVAGSLSPTDTIIGRPLRIAFDVANAGPEPAGLVRLDVGGALRAIQLTSLTTDAGSCALTATSPAEVHCELGSLAPGAVAHVVLEGLADGGPQAVVATASAPVDEVNLSDNTALLTIAARFLAADLVIPYAAFPEAIHPGELFAGELLVANLGPDEATDVLVFFGTVLQPATLLEMTASQGTCTLATCQLGTLPPGGQARVRLVVDPTRLWSADPLDGTVARLGMVTAQALQPDPVPRDASVALLVRMLYPRADLGAVATASPSPAVPGDVVTVTVELANSGPDVAAGVTFRGLGELLAALSAPVATSAPGSCALPAVPGAMLTCSVGDLPVGSVARITVRGTLAAAGRTLLTGAVGGAVVDPQPANDHVTGAVGAADPFRDVVAPILLATDVVRVVARGSLTPLAALGVSAWDAVDGPVQPTPIRVDGQTGVDLATTLAPGVHLVAWEARDAAGNVAGASQRVTLDTPSDRFGLAIPGGGTLDVSAAGGEPLSAVSVAVAPTRPGVSFHGSSVVAYEVATVPGGQATVILRFVPGLPLGPGFGLYKFDLQGRARLIPPALWTRTDAPPATTIALTLTDGGPFDLDGVANGNIVDPLALGWREARHGHGREDEHGDCEESREGRGGERRRTARDCEE